jgi:DNA polymerase III subunit epsilon
MDFVAIDFETANEERGSACEISLVRFSNGEVTEKLTSFIYQDRFSGINISIHRITERDVAKAPEFEDFWPTAREFIGSSPLVAHNAGFDMGVLYRSLKGGPVGTEIPYFCTMVLGRRAGLETAYFSLGSVAASLGVSHPGEHRAESDAITAGNVAVSLLKRVGQDDLWKLAEAFNVRPGLLSDDGPSGCVHKGAAKSLTAAERAKILESIDPSELYEDPDFVGKKVVFTGKLEHLVRRDAELAVMKAGGLIVKAVSSKTNMVVTGYQDPRVLREGADKSNKLADATNLRMAGHDIEIIDERMFMEMLENPEGMAR